MTRNRSHPYKLAHEFLVLDPRPSDRPHTRRVGENCAHFVVFLNKYTNPLRVVLCQASEPSRGYNLVELRRLTELGACEMIADTGLRRINIPT